MKVRQLLQTVVVLFATLATASGSAAERQVIQHRLAAMTSRMQAVGSFPATNRLHAAICLPLRNQVALSNLLSRIYDPSSPDFHHYLSSDEFAEQFGPTKEDYAAVVAFAQAQGLKVTTTHPNRTLVDVEGATPDFERTFHVHLKLYQHPTENRIFRAPDAVPSVDLTVPVLAVHGLDNYSLPRPAGINPVMNPPTAQQSGSGPGGYFMGYDFRKAYAPDVNPNLIGTGQSIGLVQFAGYYASDIANYVNQANLPGVPTLVNVSIDGFDGVPPSGYDLGVSEVSLDIEMVISMAPGLSKILIYESDPQNSQPIDVLNRMATDNAAKILSCSWTWGDAPLVGTDQALQQFAAQGQSFFTASGDYESYPNARFSVVQTPADNPYATVVGGTFLFITNSAWNSESVWNRKTLQPPQTAGTGGGICTNTPIPAWQQGINMSACHGSTSKRNIPDVAMVADNIWLICCNGISMATGGTSAATPLWAAFTALINQQKGGGKSIGFMNPLLYSIGKQFFYTNAFHDIVSGNNVGFNAVAGYDLCTGWGTPRGQNTIGALLLSLTNGDVVLNGGFETGDFFLWQQSGNLENTSVCSTNPPSDTTFINSGDHGAKLGPNNTFGYLSQNLQNTTALCYQISFSVNCPHKYINNEFQVFWNDLPVFDQRIGADTPGWTKVQIVAASIGPTNTLKFGYKVDTGFNYFLGLDDVSVVPIKSPYPVLTVKSTYGGASPGNMTAPSNTVLYESIVNSPVINGLVEHICTGATLVGNSFTQTSPTNVTLTLTNNATLTWNWLTITNSYIPTNTFLLNGDFELGSLANWFASSTGTIVCTSNAPYVHSGTFGAQISQHVVPAYLYYNHYINLTGMNYQLTFWVYCPASYVNNQVQVLWNGVTVFDQRIQTPGWNQEQVVVTDANKLMNDGRQINELVFGFMVDPGYSLGFDDVSLVPYVSANPTLSVKHWFAGIVYYHPDIIDDYSEGTYASPGSICVPSGTPLDEQLFNSPYTRTYYDGIKEFTCIGASMEGNDCTQVSPTEVTLSLTNNATLTWLWDINELYTPPASVRNLVQNGDFEYGDFSFWTRSGNTTKTTVSATNSTYIHSGLNGAQLGPQNTFGYLSQNLNTTAGKLYTISFWVNRPNSYIPNTFRVYWGDQPTPIFDQDIGVNGWTFIQLPAIQATNSVTTLKLGCKIASSSSYYLGLDDISVTPPPPSLVVHTDHGTSSLTDTNVPYATYLWGWIDSPVFNGTTQYVCTGATVVGNDYSQTNLPPTVWLVLTNDAVLTWNWQTQYLLTATSIGPGTVTTGRWFIANSNATLTATTNAHAHFVQWIGDINGCSGVNPLTAPMTQARSITAVFATNTETLTILSAPSVTTPGSVTVDYATPISEWMTNSPVVVGATQYVCSGGVVAGNTFNLISPTNITLTLTNNATLTWKWTTNYWLHVDKIGQGTVTTTDVWLATGTNIHVTATAAVYFVFGNWGGQTNGCTITSNQIIVVMDSGRSIQAIFNALLATNNVPKWWLAQYGLTNGGFDANALADFTGDGLPTWKKYIAGADPTNETTMLHIIHIAPDSVTFTPSFTDRVYVLLCATNLLSSDWAPVSTYLPGTGADMRLPATTTLAPQMFYRIGVQLP